MQLLFLTDKKDFTEEVESQLKQKRLCADVCVYVCVNIH